MAFLHGEYGILGYEYLHRRKMTHEERETYFNDIRSIALMMEIRDFPEDYCHYVTRRIRMVVSDLQCNAFTRELMDAYRKNLAPFSYWGLLQFQARFIHPILAGRLNLKTNRFFDWVYWLYPRVRLQPPLNRLFALMLNLPNALRDETLDIYSRFPEGDFGGVEAASTRSRLDRHRGGGHPPTPATLPCVRVPTRRLQAVTLEPHRSM